jgi:hypothetical protein
VFADKVKSPHPFVQNRANSGHLSRGWKRIARACPGISDPIHELTFDEVIAEAGKESFEGTQIGGLALGHIPLVKGLCRRATRKGH